MHDAPSFFFHDVGEGSVALALCPAMVGPDRRRRRAGWAPHGLWAQKGHLGRGAVSLRQGSACWRSPVRMAMRVGSGRGGGCLTRGGVGGCRGTCQGLVLVESPAPMRVKASSGAPTGTTCSGARCPSLPQVGGHNGHTADCICGARQAGRPGRLPGRRPREPGALHKACPGTLQVTAFCPRTRFYHEKLCMR